MILLTPEPPPTAQQSFASGHETPNSALVVGELSADQPAARAAGALARPKRASAPAATATGKAMVRETRRPPTRVILPSPAAVSTGDCRTESPQHCPRNVA